MKYVINNPTVNIGIAKGISPEYMKHMKSCKHRTATSVGKSNGNMIIVLFAYFWIDGWSGSLFSHFLFVKNIATLLLMKKTTNWINGVIAPIIKKLV